MTEGGAIVAEFGEVAAALRASFGIPTPVFAAVVSLDAVGAAASAPLRYQAAAAVPGGRARSGVRHRRAIRP